MSLAPRKRPSPSLSGKMCGSCRKCTAQTWNSMETLWSSWINNWVNSKQKVSVCADGIVWRSMNKWLCTTKSKDIWRYIWLFDHFDPINPSLTSSSLIQPSPPKKTALAIAALAALGPPCWAWSPRSSEGNLPSSLLFSTHKSYGKLVWKSLWKSHNHRSCRNEIAQSWWYYIVMSSWYVILHQHSQLRSVGPTAGSESWGVLGSFGMGFMSKAQLPWLILLADQMDKKQRNHKTSQKTCAWTAAGFSVTKVCSVTE